MCRPDSQTRIPRAQPLGPACKQKPSNRPSSSFAPRLPEASGEAVYSSLAIDPEAIERAVRLDQALALAPSASHFRRNDSGAANPTVQGLSLRSIGPSGAERALVMLNGVPQRDPFGGWVIWGGLPPETISEATVIRGAGAGSYSAGALTGVIDLHERQNGAALRIESGERDVRNRRFHPILFRPLV